MERKGLYLAIFLVSVTIVTVGFLISSKTSKKPLLEVTDVGYMWESLEEGHQLVFFGTVVNKGKIMAKEVVVHVLWTEFDGTQHNDSVALGLLPEKSSINFKITFDAEYLVTVKFYRNWVECSES